MTKPPPGEWAKWGNCQGLPTELFFSPSVESATTSHTAKAVCRECVVQSECLEYAMSTPMERDGIWGATSVVDRRRILHRRRLGIA